MSSICRHMTRFWRNSAVFWIEKQKVVWNKNIRPCVPVYLGNRALFWIPLKCSHVCIHDSGPPTPSCDLYLTRSSNTNSMPNASLITLQLKSFVRILLLNNLQNNVRFTYFSRQFRSLEGVTISRAFLLECL